MINKWFLIHTWELEHRWNLGLDEVNSCVTICVFPLIISWNMISLSSFVNPFAIWSKLKLIPTFPIWNYLFLVFRCLFLFLLSNYFICASVIHLFVFFIIYIYKSNIYISYCKRCTGEFELTLHILVMSLLCVESTFESSQSQRWWFASHNLFQNYLKNIHFLPSWLEVIKIEFSRWCFLYASFLS